MKIKEIQEKINKVLANKDLSYVIKGSFFTAASMILIQGLRMIGGVLIARYYGADVQGELRLLTVLLSSVVILANFGLKDAMLRLIPEYREKDNLRASWEIYKKGLNYLFLFGAIGAIVIISIVPWFARYNEVQDIQSILTLSAAFLFALLLNEYNVFTLRAILKIKKANYVSVIMVALRLVALILAIQFFYAEKRAPLYIYLFIICGGTAIASSYLIYKHFYLPSRALTATVSIKSSQLLQMSFPMLMTYASFLINDKADSLMIQGITKDTALLGIYGICLNLADIGRMGMQAMNVTIQPKLSQMFHSGRVHEMKNMTQKTSKTFALLNIPITLLLVFGGTFLLGIYGQEYKIGASSLAVLAIGQMINTFAGPTAQLLNVTGHHKYFMVIAFVGAMINIVLNIFFIPAYGIFGAAVASATSMASWNIIASIFIRKKFGFFVGYIPFVSELYINKKELK